MKMSSGKFLNKFETKDWVYLFVISLFLQFIIYYFSFIYGGSVKALGYISFAGTLISIILAVIAIGYTYGESIKQKSSSDQLLLEISGLRDIKNKLAGQVDILENIADLKIAVEDTKNAVNKIDFSNEIKYLQTQFKEEKKTDLNKNLNIEQVEEFVKKLSVISDHRFLEIIEALEIGNIKGIDDFLKHFSNKEYDKDARIELVIMFLSHYTIGCALGLFEKWQVNNGIKDIYKRKYPHNSNRFPPENSFTKICNRVLYQEI
ncbi:TPA: hypothetical protein MW153_002004 [Acinetobacter baumannii]|nr:hypothetical protein [Acinetobacter baumannii]